MADHVVNFLHYGAHPIVLQSLDASVTEPFLPALALAASDSPSLLKPLLSSLACHSHTPRAFAYASLDYEELNRQCKAAGQSEMTAGRRGCVADGDSEDEWEWREEDDEGGCDECDAFQQGDETERVKLAIISLQQRAASFNVRLSQGDCRGEGKVQQQEDTEGSIWSNEACLPELLCLLPVVTSRCPSLLTPECLTKGLLTARYGCLLLVTTLANNPRLVDRASHFLAQILKIHADTSEARPNSPQLQEHAPGAAKFSTGLSRQHSGPVPAYTPLPHTEHAEAAVLTLIRLCQVAPSFASICREALVNTCSHVELALHITVEILHDELEFMSRLIFSREATSQWILYHIGAKQKGGDILHLPPLGEPKAAQGGTTDSWRTKEKEGSVARVRDALLADARCVWQEDGWGGCLHTHLRLYCVLVRAGDLLPTHEEVDFWLKCLGNSSGNSGFVSVRTIQLGMAFVCLVPGLAGPSTKSLLHSAMGCLLKAATLSSSAACTPDNVELAVWLAVQLLLRRFPDIATLVREAVGMHVTVQNGLMRDVAEAASGAGVISDPSLIANAVASLRLSSPVSANKKQPDFALKCIDYLMHPGTFSFSRYSVDVSNTLMHCLSMAQEPIHPMLPQLVHSFAEMSATVPRARGSVQPFKMRPFSREWLVAAIAPACSLLSGMGSPTDAKSPQRIHHRKQVNKLAGVISSQRKTVSDSPASKRENISQAASGNPIATAALVVYYILCREQIFRSIGVDSGTHGWDLANTNSGEEGSWTELLSCLPLLPLLHYMEEHWLPYENLLPQWLSLASVVLPERFSVTALLEDPKIPGAAFKLFVEGVPATADLKWVGPGTVPSPAIYAAEDTAVDFLSIHADLEELSAPLEREMDSMLEDNVTGVESLETIVTVMQGALKEPLPALSMLQALGRASTRWGGINPRHREDTHLGLGANLWVKEAAVVKELVPLLLNPTCTRLLQDTFCVWWRSLPSSGKEYLTLLLVSSLQEPTPLSNVNQGNKKNGPHFQKVKDSQLISLSSSGLPQEPLGVLACSAIVFRTPPLLGVVLDLLMELLTASRRICLAAATEGGRDGGIKREEVSAALAAQDSAVCQILLEGCLPVAALGDDAEPGPLLEARSLICATISTLVHASPLLLKLLHFQGYDPSLVPMMVAGVPTMVQCLDFMGELMQQPSQQCQVFAVVLTAHIACSHSSLPQSLSAAQQAVAHVSQVRSKVAGSASFLQAVLSSLALCAAAFSQLAPQVVAILQSCAQAGGPLTHSGPVRDPALQTSAIAAFKQLIQLKLLHGRPPPLSPPPFSSQEIISQ